MPEDEIVDLVDYDDNVIGEAKLRECLAEGLLHRAVAVLVVRMNGDYVVQIRSRRDKWQPGMLTISATGHARKGESYGDAAKRELREELGLRDKVKAVKKYHLPPISAEKLTEHEIVYLFKCRSDEPCEIDRKELEGIREVKEPELRKLATDGPLTPDAKIILSDYLEDH